MTKRLKKVLFSIAGMIIMLVLNYVVIEKIAIPDPCYYHNRDTSFLFNLFYDLPAFEGFHPFPTKFNFLLTVGSGISLGLLLARKTPKKRNIDLIDD